MTTFFWGSVLLLIILAVISTATGGDRL